MATLDEFNKVADQAVDQAVARFREFHRRVALEAYQLAGGDSANGGSSPVWTGRYMRSHTIAIGSVLTDVVAPHPETLEKPALRWPDHPDAPYPGRGVAYAAGQLKNLQPFEIIYIANALPYARRIETGWSKLRAPNGVYHVIAEVLKTKYAHVTLESLSKQ